MATSTSSPATLLVPRSSQRPWAHLLAVSPVPLVAYAAKRLLPVSAREFLSDGRRLRRSLRACVLEGVTAEFVGGCAGAAVLTGWGLYLDCGPLLIGLLGALPFLSHVVQFPAAWLSSRFGYRRTAIVSVCASRQVFAALIPVPFLALPLDLKQAALVAVAAVSAFLGVIGNNAWTAWMAELVPGRVRGRYFGRRTAACAVGASIASMGAGILLDWAKARGVAGAMFSALAAAACLFGVVATFLMSCQHDPAPSAQRIFFDLRSALKPLKDVAGRQVFVFQIAWNAAIGLSATFFTLYMLEGLKMGFTLVALYGVLTAMARIVVVSGWGRALDRVGARTVLIVCSFATSAIPVFWLFFTPNFLWPLALEGVLSGVLWAGHNLATFALPLSVAPKEGRPFYFAAFSTVSGVSFAAAAAVGGMLLQHLPTDMAFAGRPVSAFQVLFALSAISRFASAFLSLRIFERASRPVPELFRLIRDAAEGLFHDAKIYAWVGKLLQ